MTAEDDRPQSVEEAGALLGATITRCGSGLHTTTDAPKGMHSAFATSSEEASSELFMRLHSLRSFLRSAPEGTALVAAPSLLAVLMKLLRVSRDLAAAAAAVSASQNDEVLRRTEIPPMLSTPLRKLWVDCIVLCHRLGEDLTGSAKTSLLPFMRDMMSLAGSHPRTGKAAGGTRIAAMEVLGGLSRDSKLALKMAPWSLDILQLCSRALKSSGNGEPTYRVSAVRTACSVADACRQSSLHLHPLAGKSRLFLKGAMEDKAILESVKLLKQATTDKFPEVRSAAATFATMLAPMLLQTEKRSSSSDSGAGASLPTASLEDVMYLSLKNLDDDRAEVAQGWAEALARCMSTAIEYNERRSNAETSKRNVEESETRTTKSVSAEMMDYSARFAGGKKKGMADSCSTLKGAVEYLVQRFIKVGGELAASRAGGPFSTGGRAQRVGITLCLVKLLKLHLSIGSIGDDRGLSVKDVLLLILKMAGEQTEKQLKVQNTLDTLDVTASAAAESSGTANPLFGSGGKKSDGDAGLVRVAASRVIRQGISEISSESIQMGILREFMSLLDVIEVLPDGEMKRPLYNSHQLQVVLVEASHLLASLGEATGSSKEELSRIFRKFLLYHDHGVRHEAAVACAALSSIFPEEGRSLLESMVQDVKLHLSQLSKLAAANGSKIPSIPQVPIRRMFGRKNKDTSTEKTVDPSRQHQYAVHGISLMLSLVARELPHLPGGLPSNLLSSVLSFAQDLVACQFDTVITKSDPNSACTCVRAGFGVICGLLTTGPKAIAPHIVSIFGIWQKAYKSAATGGVNFTPDHDLICLDAVLSSVNAFLQYCAELLLSVPDALSQTSLMLEEILPLFFVDGRLGGPRSKPVAISRQQSAKASLMEAFAWLPSGSFPMAADSVFDFAARHIRNAIETEVTCSILPTLVNHEDKLLDAKSLCRAGRMGQLGGARDVEESIITIKADVVTHTERESVLHLLGSHFQDSFQDKEIEVCGSRILGLFACDNHEMQPPTPLHEVGTWRKPVDPSSSSSVRLVDAAIQAFSATFGLKDGMEQQTAVEMLESLIPPILSQLARALGVDAALTEQERRSKAKEEYAAVSNITAVLLSCLQTLPLHEATHNVPVRLGPPWMNKAKDILLTLLPSASNIVRRAAAEGLAWLSTLCVTEDAHFLQSAVLHSLDEVMQGNQPDGKPKTIPLEPVSAARAGSLLTLACIQRTAQSVNQKQMIRSRGRMQKPEDKANPDEELPILQMMTRVLPSAACKGFRDYFIVRTHAIHAYGLLLAYNLKFQSQSLTEEDIQLLRKGVELVEDNFVDAWAAASADFDKGQEAEKLSTEAALLSVLLRLMTYLVPYLHHLEKESEGISCRFSCMATIILECMGSHPVVAMEGMAFFEILASHQKLLPPPLSTIACMENPLFSCIPFIQNSVASDRPDVLFIEWWSGNRGCFRSSRALRAIIRTIKLLSLSQVFIVEWSDMKIVPLLFSLLETSCAGRCFAGSTLHRSLAAPRSTELSIFESKAVEREICHVLRTLLALERTISVNNTDMLLRWILLGRQLMTNISGKRRSEEDENEDDGYSRHGVMNSALSRADNDALTVYESACPVRWQVKSMAAQLVAGAIEEMIHCCQQRGMSIKEFPEFNFEVANSSCNKDCIESLATKSRLPPSRLVFHIEDIVSAASSTAVAALDHAELQTLQSSGLLFLMKVIECFGNIADPDQPGFGILDQYQTQVISSIKHALVAPDETEGGDAPFRRYWTGCLALQVALGKGITNDSIALKRIMRPVIPTKEETPFFEIKDGVPKDLLVHGTSVQGNMRANLIPRIGKLFTVGKLFSMAPHLSDTVVAVTKELVENNVEVAVHCAALAIDGARLLLGSNLSLCGLTAETTKDTDSSLLDSAFFFAGIDDIDDVVKSAMAQAWSACACSALTILIEEMHSERADQERKSSCSEWVSTLVQLIFAGLHDSLSSLKGTSGTDERLPWSRSIDAPDVAIHCIYALTMLVRQDEEVEDQWMNEMENIIQELLESVLLQALYAGSDSSIGRQNSGFKSCSRERQTFIVDESCKLLKQLSLSSFASNEGSALLLAVLTPLDLIQRKVVEFGDESVDLIITTCLESISSILSHSEEKDVLGKAMLNVVLDLHMTGKQIPSGVASAARLLLKECLSAPTIKQADRRRVAYELAKSGNWESWSVVCSMDNGQSITESMEVLQRVLLQTSKPDDKCDAIVAIRKLIQNQAQKQLVGQIMNGVGAEILRAFTTFGTSSTFGTLTYNEAKKCRSSACADSMKIILVSFQQLVSDDSADNSLFPFLLVIFENLIPVLRFNGLPHHPAPNVGSDPALGRMIAQSIVHIARTAPAPFKSTMGSLSDVDRTLLEFAVRAEMSGYAAASAQPAPKKKLNLKSFKK